MSAPNPRLRTYEARLEEVRRNNALLEERNALLKDWRISLRNGLLTGLGGVVGATVLVTLTLTVIRPLQSVESLRPILERIAADLERGREGSR